MVTAGRRNGDFLYCASLVGRGWWQYDGDYPAY
jgi:hypothetical protein